MSTTPDKAPNSKGSVLGLSSRDAPGRHSRQGSSRMLQPMGTREISGGTLPDQCAAFYLSIVGSEQACLTLEGKHQSKESSGSPGLNLRNETGHCAQKRKSRSRFGLRVLSDQTALSTTGSTPVQITWMGGRVHDVDGEGKLIMREDCVHVDKGSSNPFHLHIWGGCTYENGTEYANSKMELDVESASEGTFHLKFAEDGGCWSFDTDGH